MDTTHIPTQAKLGESLMKRLIALREEKGGLQLEDVGALLVNLASNMHGADGVLRTEIQNMADHIQQAKQEIGAMNDGGGERTISDASLHLDAVVKSTEEAADAIMDAADKIQESLGKMARDSAAAEAEIQAALANIFEACSFQDLSVQRINKVIKLLEYLEGHITNLVTLFGNSSSNSAPKIAVDNGTATARQIEEAQGLLNGPQLSGPSQDDIDQLFASLR